ncbi:transposase, partial [Cohnella sp. GCM10012308]|uniref:transposase n=1 Tax=Cohnella sp. GCM10012308 TaxID=3317329 RepID=UPI003613EC39
MGKRLKEEARLRIVKEALAGVKVGVLARMYDIHPETIRLWIREHRDFIPPEDIPAADEHLQEIQRLQEVEQRYDRAVKALGEKELEIEILRELLKKTTPVYPRN